MFRDKMGKISGKRVIGFGALCYTIVMATLGSIPSGDGSLVGFGIEHIGAFLGFCASLLVAGVAERNK